jgi:hypothetical protein
MSANPPKWAAWLVAIALPTRDRETITGDLLEEYRESIVPVTSSLRADLWYVRQAANYARPLLVALAVAVTHLVWNLYNSLTDPFSSDTIGGDLLFIAPLLLTPIVIGFMATRQSGYVVDAVRTGILAMLILVTVGHVETFLRINVFLHQLQFRDDWVGLMERYHASGFHSLRAFANWEYFHDTPVVAGAAGAVGTALSAVGGLAARASGARPTT